MEKILNKGKEVYFQPPTRDYIVEENDLIRDLKPCDIVLYRTTGPEDLTSGIISYFTSSPYNHAELYMFDGYTIAADSIGITFRDMYKENVYGHIPVFGKKEPIDLRVDILRLGGGLNRNQRLIIEAKAYKTLACQYDFHGLFTFPFFKNNNEALRRSVDDMYVCSEHVAWCYKNAGIDLIEDVPESIESPADIGMSDILEYVGTYEHGKKIDGNYKNKFIDETISDFQKAVSNILGAFSTRDEYYAKLAKNQELLKGKVYGPN